MYAQRYGVMLTGAPALTSRELKEADFVKVVELLDRGVAIAAQAKKKSGRDSLKWNCVVCFLLGNSPVSEFCVSTFWNSLSVPSL
jgi:hypothetical protein